ncbi:MAG TPA: hypothetical protein VGH33_14830 [Isosphaeraceae bacterium]
MSWFFRQILPDSPLSWATMFVQSLAWPAASVIIAAMLRSEVRLIVERLARLKYRDFEAQFLHELGEAEGLADSPGPKRLIDLPSASKRVLHELETGVPAPWPRKPGPRAVIDAAWAELSAAADRAAGTAGAMVVRVLADRGELPVVGLLAFDRLRRLHARFAGESDWQPSPGIAERFAAVARSLAARLAQPPTPAGASGGPFLAR